MSTSVYNEATERLARRSTVQGLRCPYNNDGLYWRVWPAGRPFVQVRPSPYGNDATYWSVRM